MSEDGGEEPDWDASATILDELAAPLIAAGWEPVEAVREWEQELGFSLILVLGRDGVVINLEYCASGEIVGYEDEPLYDPETDEPSDPKFTIFDPTPEAVAEAFRDTGWI